MELRHGFWLRYRSSEPGEWFETDMNGFPAGSGNDAGPQVPDVLAAARTRLVEVLLFGMM
jgi:hypothetical protein